MRLSVCASVSAASVRLSLWVSAPPLRVFRSCHHVSDRLSASVTGVRPGPRGVWVSAPREGEGGEVAARGGGEGRGRRQWAGAGAGGGAVRPGGGVCGGPEAAAVRVGSACAGKHRPPPAPGAARPGPARPPQVSLPPRPGPSPGPRPIPRPGKCALPEGSGPPNGTPTAPPGLPSDAPRRPTLILNSSLAAAYLRSPAREPAPCRAGRRLCSRIPVGTPERPFPRPPPSVGPLEDAPCLGRNPSCAGCWRRVDSPPPQIPQPQRPCAAPSRSPLRGPGVPLPRGLRLYFGERGGSAEAPSYN